VRLPLVPHGELVAARSGRYVGVVRVHDGELLWRVEVGGADDEGALVATDQALVVVTTGDRTANVTARDWLSGSRLWSTAAPGAPAGRAARSAADVQLLTATDSETLLHSLDPATGEVRWVRQVPPSCTIVLARERHTLLGSRELLGEGSGLYRLTTATGEITRLLSDAVWSLHRGDVVDVASTGSYTSPEDAFVLALEPGSGEAGWRQPARRELVDVDGAEVACVEEVDGEHVVVLRDAASGSEIWRSEPRDLDFAGLVFFTGDAVGVVDIEGLWFADRTTGEDLGVVDIDDMTAAALCVTPAGIVLGLGNGLGHLRQA
jgi:outer membrane protein assembly factor BamB